MAEPREWNAAAYDALPLPHERWGLGVIERLEPRGDEHVLDAGSGTGRDTALLLQRLPGGRVTAIDASAAMLERLRERLRGELGRVDVVRADLAHRLPVTGAVDATMSVAALHWLSDHRQVFANLAVVMRPGARLVAECGGHGNIAAVLEAVRSATGDDSSWVGWTFATPAQTKRALAEAGFIDIQASLRPDPIRLEPAHLLDYLRTVVLGRHLDRLPPHEHDVYVRAVADAMPEPVIDYVRLELSARRA